MGTSKELHRTALGAEINMDLLRTTHADTVALGNASMNARGDKIDGKGQVLVRRDQIIQNYHRNNEDSVKQVSLKNMVANAETPAQAIARLEKEINAKKSLSEQSVQSQPDDSANVVNKNKARKLLDKSE
jgi:hypothetical protein